MQNKYYILKPAVDTEETGHVFPAVESYPDYDFKGPNSVHKLNSREFPNFVPDIRFKLAKGAKLCDMMGQAAINATGLLISEKLKTYFEKFSLVSHNYYPATIETNGKLIKYYWIHLVWEEGRQLINYSESRFFKRKFSNNLGYLDIKSEKDLQSYLDEFKGRFLVGFELLRFRELPNYDLMPIPYNVDIIISMNIKNSLSEFTGLEIKEISYVDFTDLNPKG